MGGEPWSSLLGEGAESVKVANTWHMKTPPRPDDFPSDYMATPQAEWFQKLGFTDDVMNWQVSRLSTGEKQRLSFIRAMVNQPRMLLLDRATSSLDHHHSSQLEHILVDLRQQQKIGLIWVSHDLEQLQRVSNRIFRLEKKGLQNIE